MTCIPPVRAAYPPDLVSIVAHRACMLLSIPCTIVEHTCTYMQASQLVLLKGQQYVGPTEAQH